MIDWLAANIANIIITAAVIAVVILAVISIVRRKRSGKTSCGCGCADCAMASRCHSDKKITG